MNRIALIGDHYATNYTFSSAYQVGIGSLPVNDVQLANLLKFAFNRFDTIFWSCSYPLFGCSAINILRQLSSQPFEKRLIDYRTPAVKRRFYGLDFWQSLTPQDYDFLWANYRAMLGYYLSLYGQKIILLPIAAYWFDANLGIERAAMPLIDATTDRVVEISFDNAESFQPDSHTGSLLTPAGFELIRPRLEGFL